MPVGVFSIQKIALISNIPRRSAFGYTNVGTDNHLLEQARRDLKHDEHNLLIQQWERRWSSALPALHRHRRNIAQIVHVWCLDLAFQSQWRSNQIFRYSTGAQRLCEWRSHWENCYPSSRTMYFIALERISYNSIKISPLKYALLAMPSKRCKFCNKREILINKLKNDIGLGQKML